MNITETLIQAALAAPEDRKLNALRILRGEHEPDRNAIRGKSVEPYVGLKEVAEFMGVSARSVWRWKVPGHKLGSRTRFRLSEVARYLESEAFREREAELREARVAAK